MKNKTKLELEDLLPTDEEVAKWYDLNIDPNDATVSSGIYKFRLFLRDYIKLKLSPIQMNIGGFKYVEKKTLKS